MIGKIFRGLGIALLSVAALLLAVSVFARFQDGPIAMFPGGVLEAGEWAEPSWQDASGLTEVGQIELQLVEPPVSRITWVLVLDGVAYVPCGLPTLVKKWPHHAMKDGRAVVRVEGKRHRRTLVRVTDPKLTAALMAETVRKYDIPSGGEDDADSAWFFRLDPRPAS